MRLGKPGMKTMLKTRSQTTYLRPSSCRLGFGRGFLRGDGVHLTVDETALRRVELEATLTCVTVPAEQRGKEVCNGVSVPGLLYSNTEGFAEINTHV